MAPEVQILLEKALKARALYIQGKIPRSLAHRYIDPYIDVFNEKSREISKKYNQRPKLISFSKFVR